MKFQILVWFASFGLCLGQSDNATTTTSSTASPPPPASPPVPVWKVGNENQTCVLVAGKFTYVITSNSTDGLPETHRLEIPATANATGRCMPVVNIMSLSWPDGNLTFIFIKRNVVEDGVDTGKAIYWLTGIFGPITTSPATKASPAVTTYSSVRQPNFMSTSANKSFSCETLQTLPASRTGTVLIEISQLRVEAFRESLDESYSESESCPEDVPDDSPEVIVTSYSEPPSPSLSSSLPPSDNPPKDNISTDKPLDFDNNADQEDSNRLDMPAFPLLGYTALAVAVAASAGSIGYLAWRKFARGQYREF